MRPPFRVLVVALGLCPGLGACTVGPDYARPQVISPDQFRFVDSPGTAQTIADAPAFTVFGDQVLQSLLKDAITNNLDLQVALARIEEARARAGIAKSYYYPQVDAAVRKSGVREGLVLVNAMHITASVFINDDERGLHQDYAAWLEHLAPFDASPERYAHNRTGEDNADAHMKRQIMGREVVVAITAGKLDFGPWEQIFYGEFDGRRRKRVLVKIIGD